MYHIGAYVVAKIYFYLCIYSYVKIIIFEMETHMPPALNNKTSEVRINKKSVTTKLPPKHEQPHAQYRFPERNRSNSHFQFSTKLTYAPLLKTKKPSIHPSPISLCPSNTGNELRLDTLEELSFLSETEDDNENAFCLDMSDEETAIEHSIKAIRTCLKNTFDSLCNKKTMPKESDAVLNSKKIFCKLFGSSSYHTVSETKCKRKSFWRNSIKHSMFNSNYNSFAGTSNTSTNNLSILSILEASVNEYKLSPTL